MKNILSILLVSVFLLGCSKSGDSPNDVVGSILGTWKVDNYTNTFSHGYIDPVLGTEVVTFTEVSTGPSVMEEYVTFRYDNTLLNYIYVDNTLLEIDTFNYTKNGNEIIIEAYTVLTITQLTNTNLRYNSLNPDETYSSNDTIYFDRTTVVGNMSKSNIPSITITPLNKKKPVSSSNSFLNRRENR